MKVLIKLFSVFILTIIFSGCASILWTKNAQTDKKFICLTFDDGPNGEATLKTLEVLKKHDVKAAFFVLGKNVERYPEIAKRIAYEGHIIGSHSYGHNNFLAFCSKNTIKKDLQNTGQIIKNATGLNPSYFRPPNAMVTKNLLEVCKDLELKVVGTNIFVNDSFLSNADLIVKKCVNEIDRNGGGILVLHDGFGTHKSSSRKIVSEALDCLIPILKEKNYTFISLNQLY